MSHRRRLVLLTRRDGKTTKTTGNDRRSGRSSVGGHLAVCFLFLLDVSGSMFTKDLLISRIEAACRAVVETVRYILAQAPESLVGIGTFSDGFHRCTRPRQVGEESDTILASLDDLGDPGNTNLTAGLKGLRRMMRRFKDMQVVAVILTDGRHHVGPDEKVIAAADALKDQGVDVHAVGIGGDPSVVGEDLLRKVVTDPENYVFIGNWEGPQAIIDQFIRIAGLYFLENDTDKEG